MSAQNNLEIQNFPNDTLSDLDELDFSLCHGYVDYHSYRYCRICA